MLLTLPSHPRPPELQAVLVSGLTAPADALRQAQTIVQTQSTPDTSPDYRAQAALTLGLALNRSERYAAALVVLTDNLITLKALGLPAEWAICYWQIGVAQRVLRRSAGFLEHLERAVTALESAGLHEDAVLCRRDLAVACNWRGDYARSADLTVGVRRYFEDRGRPADAALCATIESAHLRWRGRLAEAVAVLNEAGQQFATVGLPVEQATIALYRGAAHTAQMAFDQALADLRPAQAVFEQHDLPVRLMLCRNELGNIALAQGHLRVAEAAYQLNAATTQALEMPADQALALLNLANVRYYQGDLLEAHRLYTTAQRAFDSLGDQLSSLNCQQNLGLIQASRGHFVPAIRQLSDVATRFTAIGAQVHLAATHHILGRTWLDLGDTAQASTHFAEAQTIYLQASALFPAARSMLHQALAEAEHGNFDQALAQVAAARVVCAAHAAPAYLAMCDQIAGQVQLEAGHAQDAVTLLLAAEQAFLSLNMPVNAAACRVAQAEAYLRLDQTTLAESLFQQALDQLGEALPDLAWRCTAGLAEILDARQQHAAALDLHRQTVHKLGLLRGPLDHELLVEGFFARRGAALHRALHAAATYGDPEAALALVEASRARLLARRYGQPQRAAAPSPNPPPSALPRLRQEIAELRYQLGQTGRAEPGRPHLRSHDQQQLLDQLEMKAQQYARLSAIAPQAEAISETNVPPFDLAQLRARLNQTHPEGWTSLAYYWLDQRLLIFMVDADQVQCWETQPHPIQQLALELCSAIDPNRRRLIYQVAAGAANRQAQASRTYRQSLYQWLVPAAVRQRLTPEHLLLIAPAGALHGLPFQTLLDGEMHLGEQATVVLTPSLSSLAYAPLRDRAPNWSRALIVAIEDFANGLPRLPHALREAAQLEHYFDTPVTLTGPAATRPAVCAALDPNAPDPPGIAHFATHAMFEAGMGRLARVALHNEDWQADDIAASRLSASLVVLSTCHAALAHVHPGEEVVGLSQAFLAAGADAVLSALWTLPDASAADFMIAFYARLVQNPAAPQRALAATQRTWIAAGRPPHEWAPYVLHGQPRAGGLGH